MGDFNEIVPLYGAKRGVELEVASVPQIGLLQSLGIRAGTCVSIIHRYVFGGPVLVRVNGAYTVAVGKDIAAQIGVREIIANVGADDDGIKEIRAA